MSRSTVWLLASAAAVLTLLAAAVVTAAVMSNAASSSGRAADAMRPGAAQPAPTEPTPAEPASPGSEQGPSSDPAAWSGRLSVFGSLQAVTPAAGQHSRSFTLLLPGGGVAVAFDEGAQRPHRFVTAVLAVPEGYEVPQDAAGRLAALEQLTRSSGSPLRIVELSPQRAVEASE